MGEKKGKNTVFYVSLIIVGIIAVWSVAFNDSFTVVANAAFKVLTTDFGWLYLISMIIFFGFIVYFAFGKYGKIRLGSDDSRPEYSNMTWFGLLFGCGMGVGLVFWGVAEPLTYYLNPPDGIEAASQASANFAFENFFMHWGILPWANYAVIGLALAYFMFRKNKKGLLSVMLEPLIGEKLANGWLGKVVDILGVFATVAGVVTFLGLGTLQINAGFNYLFGVPINLVVEIIIIIIVSFLYIGSAVSGLDKGIKIISDTNLYVAIGLLAVCFIVGPKVETLNAFVNGMGQYIGNFIPTALKINSYSDNSWFGSWRLFYWAWFIAWAPFVGVFVARISKGRTIREFVLGVVLVPTIASCIWGAVFGNLGINLGEKGLMAIEKAPGSGSNTGGWTFRSAWTISAWIYFITGSLGILVCILCNICKFRSLCTVYAVNGRCDQSSEWQKDSLGSYPVSYGDRTSDGWWIETASDNLTCSSVLIYFCNAWNDCSIY